MGIPSKDDGTFKARWVVRGYGEQDLLLRLPPQRSLPPRFACCLPMLPKASYSSTGRISSAFLNSSVDRALYVRQPTGFAEGSQVCKLNRSLYDFVRHQQLV